MRRSRMTAACGLLSFLIAGPALAFQDPEPAPIPGQPYLIPAAYAGTPVGSFITYGEHKYLIRSDGTMLHQPEPSEPPKPPDGPLTGQSYLIPQEFAGARAGATITVGGYKYTVGGDGTMTQQAGVSAPARPPIYRLSPYDPYRRGRPYWSYPVWPDWPER